MFSSGQQRDERVLAALERYRYMTTIQVADLYFESIRDPQQKLKKASERLKKLYDRGLCYRMRIPNEYYIYSSRSGGYNHKVRHYLTIVDVWRQLLKIRPTGSSLYCEVEHKQDDVITDLYVKYSNEWRKEERHFFVEVELDSSGSLEEKISKYEALFWRRRRDKERDDVLVIVTPKRLSELTTEGQINLKVVNLGNIVEEWTW